MEVDGFVLFFISSLGYTKVNVQSEGIFIFNDALWNVLSASEYVLIVLKVSLQAASDPLLFPITI